MSVNIKIDRFRNYNMIDIEMSDFLIFCGDNGNGKTQLVKVLDGIDSFIRDSPYKIIRESQINNEHENIYEKITGIYSPQIQTENTIKITKTDFIYEFFLHQLNHRLNDEKDYILTSVFGDAIKDDIDIEGISVIMSEFPDISFEIKQTNNIEDLEKEISLNPFLEEDEEEDEDEEDSLTFKLERYKYELKIHIDEDNELGIEFTIPAFFDFEAMSNTVIGIISSEVMNVLYNFNFKTKSKNTLYLPPSREIYMRDNKYFIQNRSQNNNIRIEETKPIYDVDVKNVYSDDPSIEKFALLLNNSRSTFSKGKESKLLDYFEKDLLKAKIVSESDNLYYKCGDQTINPLAGSSLLNEYSSLDIIIKSNPLLKRIIIEEPESHLSVSNTFKMVQFLSELFINDYRIWMTTHNTVVGDAINSIILLASLNEDKRNNLIESYDLNPALKEIPGNKFENINAYFLNNSHVERLEKGRYGIEFTLFENQLNNFLNFVAEVQETFDEELDNE